MRLAQELMLHKSRSLWVSYYSNRPAQLFEGAQNFLSIFIVHKAPRGDENSSAKCTLNTTKLYRWASTERSTLFSLHHFTSIDRTVKFPKYAFPKFASLIENSIAKKILSKPRRLSDSCRDSGSSKNWAVYCYGGVYWTKARTFDSPVIKNGIKAKSTADRPFFTDGQITPLAAVSLLNSGTHFWFWANFSDCRNKTYSVILDIPIDTQRMAEDQALVSLGRSLMSDYKSNAERKVRDGKRGRTEFDEFYPKKSKSLLDEIDRTLGDHFGFSDEELDYILNYEVKYRLGADEDDEEEVE
jgi:hypothetical protein